MTDSTRRLWITAALVGVCAVWGGTFVMVKNAVAGYPLYSFLWWRFLVATVAFLVLFPKSVKRFRPGTLAVGVLAGVFLTGGYIFQTWGLMATTASKAAFITGMFVVITPALQAVVLRRPPRLVTLAGVAFAVVGLWLLSGASADGWTVGDTRVFLCAIAYSAHMIVLGGPGHRHDSGALTLVQLATVAVACGIVALFTEHAPLPSAPGLLVALGVTGVLASAVAFAVQTYAQRYLSPTKTALILIMEPVFGGVFGWLAGDALGARGIAGSAFILGGMMLAEVIGAVSDTTGRVELEQTIEGPMVAVLEEPDGGVQDRG